MRILLLLLYIRIIYGLEFVTRFNIGGPILNIDGDFWYNDSISFYPYESVVKESYATYTLPTNKLKSFSTKGLTSCESTTRIGHIAYKDPIIYTMNVSNAVSALSYVRINMTFVKASLVAYEEKVLNTFDIYINDHAVAVEQQIFAVNNKIQLSRIIKMPTNRLITLKLRGSIYLACLTWELRTEQLSAKCKPSIFNSFDCSCYYNKYYSTTLEQCTECPNDHAKEWIGNDECIRRTSMKAITLKDRDTINYGPTSIFIDFTRPLHINVFEPFLIKVSNCTYNGFLPYVRQNIIDNRVNLIFDTFSSCKYDIIVDPSKPFRDDLGYNIMFETFTFFTKRIFEIDISKSDNNDYFCKKYGAKGCLEYMKIKISDNIQKLRQPRLTIYPLNSVCYSLADHMCMIDFEGRLHCEGNERYFSTLTSQSTRQFSHVLCGLTVTCVLDVDGYLECAGPNVEINNRHQFQYLSMNLNGEYCGIKFSGELVCRGNYVDISDLVPQAKNNEKFVNVVLHQHSNSNPRICGITTEFDLLCSPNYDTPSFKLMDVAIMKDNQDNTFICGIALNASIICHSNINYGAILDEQPKSGTFKAILATDRGFYAHATDGTVIGWPASATHQTGSLQFSTISKNPSVISIFCGVSLESGETLCFYDTNINAKRFKAYKIKDLTLTNDESYAILKNGSLLYTVGVSQNNDNFVASGSQIMYKNNTFVKFVDESQEFNTASVALDSYGKIFTLNMGSSSIKTLLQNEAVGVTHLSVHNNHYCGIRNDKLFCTGNPPNNNWIGAPKIPEELESKKFIDVCSIATGLITCALSDFGEMYCFNQTGYLYTHTTAPRMLEIQCVHNTICGTTLQGIFKCFPMMAQNGELADSLLYDLDRYNETIFIKTNVLVFSTPILVNRFCGIDMNSKIVCIYEKSSSVLIGPPNVFSSDFKFISGQSGACVFELVTHATLCSSLTLTTFQKAENSMLLSNTEPQMGYIEIDDDVNFPCSKVIQHPVTTCYLSSVSILPAVCTIKISDDEYTAENNAWYINDFKQLHVMGQPLKNLRTKFICKFDDCIRVSNSFVVFERLEIIVLPNVTNDVIAIENSLVSFIDCLIYRLKNVTSTVETVGSLVSVRSTTLTLRNVKMLHGDAFLGGGIQSINSKLYIYESDFIKNRAESGAVLSIVAGSELTLINSRFLENRAISQGVIFVENSGIVIIGCEFEDNIGGSVLYGRTSSIILFQSKCSNNQVRACILADATTVSVKQSNISNNQITESSDFLACSDYFGGSIAILYGWLDVTNTECFNNSVIISSESTISCGGCLHFQSSSITLRNTKLSYNRAALGGAICALYNSTLYVNNSSMSHNHATDAGGAIASINSEIILMNKTQIVNNIAVTDGGGGVLINNYNFQLSNDTLIIDNRAVFGGGGGLFTYKSKIDSTSIIHSNQAYYSTTSSIVASPFYLQFCNTPPTNADIRKDITPSICIQLVDRENNSIVHVNEKYNKIRNLHIAVSVSLDESSLSRGSLIGRTTQYINESGMVFFDKLQYGGRSGKIKLIFTTSYPIVGLIDQVETLMVSTELNISACRSGYQYVEQQGVCQLCSAGYYSIGNVTECSKCLDGFVQSEKDNINGSSSCSPCSAGRFSSSSIECKLCQPGFYSPLGKVTTCYECSSGKFSTEGSSKCIQCLPPTFQLQSKQTSCENCPTGFYSLCPTNNCTGECLACPDASICVGGEVIPADKNTYLYRTSSGYYKSFICKYCKDDGECEDDREPIQTNPLCGKCANDLVQWGAECLVCNEINWFLVIIMIVASFVLTMFVFYDCQITTGPVKIWMYFVQMGILFLNTNNKNDHSLVDWAKIFEFNPFDATSGTCFFPISQFSRLWLGYLIPAICILLLFCVYFIHYIIVKCCRYNNKFNQNQSNLSLESSSSVNDNYKIEEKEKFQRQTTWIGRLRSSTRVLMPWQLQSKSKKSKSALNIKLFDHTKISHFAYFRGFIGLFLFSFNTLLITSLQYFDCVNIEESVSLVREFPGVSCLSNEYKAFYPIRVIITLLVCVIVPLVLLGLVIFGGTKNILDSRRFRQIVGIMFEAFSLESYYYGVVILFRRSILIICAVFIRDNNLLILLFCMFNFIFFLMHTYLQPFGEYYDNIFENISLMVLTLISILKMDENLSILASIVYLIGFVFLFIRVVVVKLKCMPYPYNKKNNDDTDRNINNNNDNNNIELSNIKKQRRHRDASIMYLPSVNSDNDTINSNEISENLEVNSMFKSVNSIEELFDPETKLPYYHNTLTGETTWEPPQ